MEDEKIIELYWQRSPQAIDETSRKYGAYCMRLSMNILMNREDSEENVNDTYLRTWNAIPPQRPQFFAAFLGRIARNLEKPPKLTEEVKIVRKSLSEMLKENRTRCKMTQEFVAESIGVSRQAVSKWENGTSEPNTSNLMALARLYGIPAEDLRKGVESALEAEGK